MTRQQQDDGFTIIEMLVAVVLIGTITIGLFTSLSNIYALSEGSSQRQRASNLAQANLNQFSQTTPLWFECDTTNETAPQTMLDESGSVEGLPGNVERQVVAEAVYGCADSDAGYPIRLTSTVGLISGVEVRHATYVSF